MGGGAKKNPTVCIFPRMTSSHSNTQSILDTREGVGEEKEPEQGFHPPQKKAKHYI
jgi:hypothetical protein